MMRPGAMLVVGGALAAWGTGAQADEQRAPQEAGEPAAAIEPPAEEREIEAARTEETRADGATKTKTDQ